MSGSRLIHLRGRIEGTHCITGYRAVLEFFLGFEDKTVSGRYQTYEARARLQKLVGAIVLNGRDAGDKGQPVLLDRRSDQDGLRAVFGLDWAPFEGALMALGALDLIAFDPSGNDDSITYRLSNLRAEAPRDTPVTPDEKSKQEARAKELDYSELLNVHTSSDHPEVKEFIDRFYDEYFSGGNLTIRKKHLKVILLDLYVRWRNDPKLKTAFARDITAYKPRSRYNKLHFSKTSIAVVDRLRKLDLLEQAIGYFFEDSGKRRVTRIWPTENLIKKFEEARFGPLVINTHTDQECIILRDVIKGKNPRRNAKGNMVDKETIEREYNDTPKTIAMRQQLTAYNDLLARSFIDIPVLDEPFIQLNEEVVGSAGFLHVNQNRKFVRRIFNRRSFDKGGRFWGGWWQTCPKLWRQSIFINENPTSEVDFSGLHIVMLYARIGQFYCSS